MVLGQTISAPSRLPARCSWMIASMSCRLFPSPCSSNRAAASRSRRTAVPALPSRVYPSAVIFRIAQSNNVWCVIEGMGWSLLAFQSRCGFPDAGDLVLECCQDALPLGACGEFDEFGDGHHAQSCAGAFE